MVWRRTAASVLGLSILAMGPPAPAQTPPPSGGATFSVIPDSFVDPETHLRVIHLSRMPNERSGVIYFTYPSFTQDSRLALIDVQFADKWRHLYAFDFVAMAVRPLVTDRLTQNQVVAPKTGNLYYQADNAAWVTNLRGGTPRKIADLPAKWSPGSGFSVNADETLLMGASTDLDVPTGGSGDGPAESEAATFAKHEPNVLFTIDVRSGAVKVIHRIDTWLGHVQFSPTDPGLAMFCHEGPWEQVDRMWTIRIGQAQPTLVFKRSEPREIAGHEFWAPDGKSVWFQQTFRARRGKAFLSGKDLATGKLTQYTVPEGGRGIHFTWSPAGTYLISDGSGPKSATPGPNKYLSLLVPDGDHVRVTKLCSLQRNDYSVEPNPHASPDNRWVIFTATLFGTPQAYAVEVPPAVLATALRGR
jgi:oligogalacturonide lyase